MLSWVISVTYLNLIPLSLNAAILFSLMASNSIITDAAALLTTESIFAFALSTNCSSTLIAKSEPWYTSVNVSSELPVGDGVDGDGYWSLSMDSLGLVLLLSILLLTRTGPPNRCHDTYTTYLDLKLFIQDRFVFKKF